MPSDAADAPFDLDNFLPYRLNVAATRVSRLFSTRYAAEAGISIPEWRVLAHLSRSGQVSVREIHERVHMDKSKVSRAAASLEAAGLVRKTDNTSDKRLVSLELTDHGRDLMRRLTVVADTFQAELLVALGSDAPGLSRALESLMGKDGHDPL